MHDREPIEAAPDPPYLAVIFTSRRSASHAEEYARMSALMEELASQQDGFLGIDSARDDEGGGMTVSYWRDESAIERWRNQAEHRVAQELGYERFYERFGIRVARVERQYGFSRD